jgi:two-component system OmpR family response regulator
LIRRSAGQTTSQIDVGGVVINTRARSINREGRQIPLTAREYAIFEYLALHRGEVVTRTALYEHLFDENEDTMSNLLDVHIFSIRKKIGRDLIKTRRGQGYSIER